MTALALSMKDSTLTLEIKEETQGQLDIPKHSCRVSILTMRLNTMKERKRVGANVITAIPAASLSQVTKPPKAVCGPKSSICTRTFRRQFASSLSLSQVEPIFL